MNTKAPRFATAFHFAAHHCEYCTFKCCARLATPPTRYTLVPNPFSAVSIVSPIHHINPLFCRSQRDVNALFKSAHLTGVGRHRVRLNAFSIGIVARFV